MFSTKSLTVLSFGALFILLYLSKPVEKDPYLKQVANHMQNACCKTVEGPVQICEVAAPLIRPVLGTLLHPYTEEPKDFVFVTLYQTHLPGNSFYGLGIANRYFVWPDRAQTISACEVIDNALAFQNFPLSNLCPTHLALPGVLL